MKKIISGISAVLVLFSIAGCSKNNPVAPQAVQSDHGKIVFAMDAADNVISGKVSITKGAITQTAPITIVNHAGSLSFNGIQVGTWDIKAQLYDAAGEEIYAGSGTAMVNKDRSTVVSIRVVPNTGNLNITVLISPGIMDGQILTFKCLGNISNAQHLWLDGSTLDGSVALVPNTGDDHTGTHWRVHELTSGVFAFECLGNISNPQYVWLDGSTLNGSVTLVPNTGDDHTGTHWRVHELTSGVFAFECLGNISNPQYLWLDGSTLDGSVTLVPNTGDDHTGTHWAAVIQ